MRSDVIHAYQGFTLSSVPAAIMILPQMPLARRLRVCTPMSAWAYDDELGQHEQDLRFLCVHDRHKTVLEWPLACWEHAASKHD